MSKYLMSTEEITIEITWRRWSAAARKEKNIRTMSTSKKSVVWERKPQTLKRHFRHYHTLWILGELNKRMTIPFKYFGPLTEYFKSVRLRPECELFSQTIDFKEKIYAKKMSKHDVRVLKIDLSSSNKDLCKNINPFLLTLQTVKWWFCFWSSPL